MVEVEVGAAVEVEGVEEEHLGRYRCQTPAQRVVEEAVGAVEEGAGRVVDRLLRVRWFDIALFQSGLEGSLAHAQVLGR